MDKHTLNNFLVTMRKPITQARVHIISKLTREIKKLRKKATEEKQKEKNLQKADKLAKEVLLTKALAYNEISKYVLLFSEDPLKKMGSVSLEEKVKLRFAANKFVAKHVEAFRTLYSDWALKLPVLFVQLGFQYQKGQKTKTHNVRHKKQQNVSDIKEDLHPKKNSESITNKHELLHDTEEVIDGKFDSKEEGRVMEDTDADPGESELFIDSLSTKDHSSDVLEKKMKLANPSIAESILKEEQEGSPSKCSANVEKEKQNIVVEKKARIAEVRKFSDFLKTTENAPESTDSVNVEKEKQNIVVEKKARIAEVRRFSDFLKTTENAPESTEDTERMSSSDENENVTKDPFFLSGSRSEQSSSSEDEESKPKVEPEIRNGVRVNRKLRRMLLKSNSGNLNLRRIKNKDLVAQFKTIKGYQTYGSDNMHPSWAAKKKEREIVPFQGKKIVFNDD